MTPAVVAVDVGGTTIKSGTFAADRADVATRPTGRERGVDAVVDEIGDVLAVAERHARAAGRDVTAAAVAVPGIVDEREGVGALSVTFGWRDLRLADRLAGLPFPVVVRHDVRAAARAEAAAGAAHGAPSALVVVVGTGIAAATVLDGTVLDGATSRAGEIGQVGVVDPEVGQAVTLEHVASARAIAERYARRTGRAAVTAADVADHVDHRRGDPEAVVVWHEAIDALADALSSAVVLVDPALIVVGGGLSRAGRAVVEPLRDALGHRLGWRASPEVRTARFADLAGLAGAALAAAAHSPVPVALDRALAELAAPAVATAAGRPR